MYSAAQFALFLAVILLAASMSLQDMKVMSDRYTCTKFGITSNSTCSGKCSECTDRVVHERVMNDKVLENSMCTNLTGTAHEMCTNVEKQSIPMFVSAVLVILATFGALIFHGSTVTGIFAAIGGIGLIVTTTLLDPTVLKNTEQMKPTELSLGCSNGLCIGHGTSYFLVLIAGILSLMASLPIFAGPVMFAY